MSGPTTGVGRIVIPYTVSGFDHVCRMYVANPTLSGSDWVIDKHSSIGGTGLFSDAAQGLAEFMSSALATGVTPGTALLEEWSPTGWLPRDTATVTFPALNGGTSFATQLTLTLRADDFTRPKIVLMEVNNPGPLAFPSPTSGGANIDGFIDGFLESGTGANRPWVYMTTMHEIELLDDSFVRSTITYNEQLARKRGLK